MEKFEGVIGRTYEESTPWWPEIKQPPEESPNIVVLVLDVFLLRSCSFAF